MNFYVDSGGTILAVDQERIFQGSAMANTVRFIGSFPSNASVLVSYTLPDETKTLGQLMTFNKELSGVVSEKNGVTLGIWEQKIGIKYVEQDDGTIKPMPDYSVLEQAGKVEVHFTVTQADNNGNPITQTTAASSFICEKGTTLEMPSEAFDEYESLLNQILAQLSLIENIHLENAEKIAQLEENALLKSQVGVANGVAPLNESGKVPSSYLLVDTLLSVESENPVQNKVVSGELRNIKYFLTQKADKTELSNYPKLIDGKIPSSYLPSYVDDVLEYDKRADFPRPGESGKIYVDKSTNYTYRWSGTDYIPVGGKDYTQEIAEIKTSLAEKADKTYVDEIAVRVLTKEQVKSLF